MIKRYARSAGRCLLLIPFILGLCSEATASPIFVTDKARVQSSEFARAIDGFHQLPDAITIASEGVKQEQLMIRLHRAITSNDLEGAKALMAAGADPNGHGKAGHSAVHLAAFSANLDTLEFILSHGGQPDNQNALTGATPLVLAILSYDDHRQKLKRLLDAGADPNIADNNGDTPLHTAARTNAGDIIIELLEAGASPLARNSRDMTFQSFYFGYSTKVLNDLAKAERRAVAEWLAEHDIPLEQ